MPDDRIEREIEEILNRLDTFVPEESAASRMRRKSSGAASSFLGTLLAPLAAISIRHVMLTALALIVLGFLVMRANPVGTWMLIGGVVLFLTSFVLSLASRGSGGGGTVEKRWRGQPIELNEPSFGERLKAWFQSKRRPRY